MFVGVEACRLHFRCALFVTSALLVSMAASAQKIPLPCDLPDISVAADGSGTWAVCRKLWPDWVRKSKNQTPPPPPPGANSDATELYWIRAGSDVPQKVASAKAVIQVIPAPTTARALVVMPEVRSWGRVVLYDGPRKVKELAVDAYVLLWGTDANRIYFYGGTTVEADAWNILAVYDLDTGKVKRAKLREPTEIVGICPSTGSVFTATPRYAGHAGNTIEYSPDLLFLRRVTNWIGVDFSAHCSYVSSPWSYHGPLPWTIYEVASGRILASFPSEDEGKDTYEPVAWNPKYDSLLLRKFVSHDGKNDRFEVFDVTSGHVLLSLRGAGSAVWSGRGAGVTVTMGRTLTTHRVPAPSR